MEINVKNLGYISSGSLDINKLTIICGENGTGKTYLSYALYGLLKHLRTDAEFDISKDEIDKLLSEGFLEIKLDEVEQKLPNIIKKISAKYSNQLYDIFSTQEELFSESTIELILDKTKITIPDTFKSVMSSKDNEILSIQKEKESNSIIVSLISNDLSGFPKTILASFINKGIASFLFSNIIKSPFPITSERTGISLFYKDLDDNRNQIVDYLTNSKKLNPIEMIMDLTSRYALPIKDNIKYIRDFDNIKKRKSFIQKANSDESKFLLSEWKKLIGGKFEISGNGMYYQQNKRRNSPKIAPLPIHATSSSIKSLVLLDIYINNIAEKNDILLIDEPELNLHPTKQILFARIIALLVNMGIEVFITTHSDYILKEINNLIMLNSVTNNRDVLLSRHKYNEKMILSSNDINVYLSDTDQKLQKLKVDEQGIDIALFDDTIMNINEISDDIYYSMDS